jgi:hypothetical protein
VVAHSVIVSVRNPRPYGPDLGASGRQSATPALGEEPRCEEHQRRSGFKIAPRTTGGWYETAVKAAGRPGSTAIRSGSPRTSKR